MNDMCLKSFTKQKNMKTIYALASDPKVVKTNMSHDEVNHDKLDNRKHSLRVSIFSTTTCPHCQQHLFHVEQETT